MCRLRTYLSLRAVKTSQNLPNDGATPTLRNGRVQLLSGHLDCFNGPRPAATSHKRPRKQRKVGLWNCLRAVRSDSPVLEGRPTVLHNIDHSNIFAVPNIKTVLLIGHWCLPMRSRCTSVTLTFSQATATDPCETAQEKCCKNIQQSKFPAQRATVDAEQIRLISLHPDVSSKRFGFSLPWHYI